MKRCVCCLAALLALALCALACADGAPVGGVAGADDMTDVLDIVDPNMTPVTPDMLNDGVYEVAVDSSSSMFKVTGCELNVQDGAFTVKLFMKSGAYTYMYAGTAEQAAEAPAEELAPLTEDGELQYFPLPVDALDAGYTCAAFSDRKQVWYPRTLVFRSESLPLEAWKPEYVVTAETLGLADGAYTCDVALTGAGKATVESPVTLTVEQGVCIAEIVFSTKKIDYALVDGEKYLPVNAEGNAAFVIPVTAFDRRLGIIVDSTAIKPATEVAYELVFDSQSITPCE